MIITLSPAKLMKFEALPTQKLQTDILFPDQTKKLIDELKQFSIEEIAKLMSINPKQAMDAFQQINGHDQDRTSQLQAAFAYTGIAYQGLDAKSLTEREFEYAQKHLVILSGLYGALRPADMIKPYRLEMQAKLTNDAGSDLYSFWTETLTKYLSERLSEDNNIWVNLMSKEYTKAIKIKALPKGVQIIEPNFKEQTPDGKFKQIVVHTKKARGLMARFIIKNEITDIEHLKAFDEDGYIYSNQLSNKKEWVFIR